MNAGSVETAVTTGEQIHQLIRDLFPICRSITGNGVRATLNILRQHIPIELHEVASGTPVFDWVVPKEWNIRDAYIKNSAGEKVVDFRQSNLHVLNYSVPINRQVPLDELRKHLHYLPDQPDWIPYRTSYYKEDWGFCLSYRQYQTMRESSYEVVIDATLEPGSLTYGEVYLPGESEEEVLISTHICHPSLGNDNLSSIGVLTFLIQELAQMKRHYSYRFIFIPGTIGAITWLAVNKDNVGRIKYGLVASLLGDTGVFHYKRSRRGNTETDRIAEYVLRRHNPNNRIIDFVPYGYDERQFCSPGFDLPMGSLTRTTYGEYPEYHTSADNLEFVKASSLEESLGVYMDVIKILETNKTYINLNPYCEPQLGKRGLYDLKGGDNQGKDFQMALLWVLSLSDGDHNLLEVAKRSGINFDTIRMAADRLEESGLLKEKK